MPDKMFLHMRNIIINQQFKSILERTRLAMSQNVLGMSSWFPIMCKWNAFTIDSL